MISVVVPAYNAAATLPACIAALRQQTYVPDEIIVVDDGSTDESANVVKRHAAHLLQQPHQGPAAARNLGAQSARGDWVLFTDADCEPTDNWVEQMLAPFADPQVVGVKGAYRTRQRQVVARLVQCEFEERYDRLERFGAIDFVDAHAAAFRTEALRGIGGFDPAFPQANNEDVDLSYRLAETGSKMLFNRRAVVYHRHPATWIKYLRVKIKRGYWRIMAYRLHPGKALHDSYTPQLLKVQTLLVGLGLISSIAVLLWPIAAWLTLACLSALVLSALPFMRVVARREPALIIWAPFFILVRALSLAIGAAGGTVGMFFFRPTLSGTKGEAVRQQV
ncbi:MAG: glycosyltransferase [Chloroflexota bacterium]|nr:glycosyltransferase [Chloroflexota bacterium]